MQAKLRKQQNKAAQKEENEGGAEDGAGKEQMQQAMGKIFRYRRNELFDEMVRQERHKESMVILQAFRYLVRNNHV